ncbi:isoaspartyl peptidase/L-asparaginase [Flavobacteriales bacterium]|jgi:beta-aspartyl-peptidase (threonine type)|nr:isoaspartyl peptidase/L-asparaginase [Flavobacteriales bacterium]
MNNKIMKYTIIVHGGAWDIPEEYHEAHKNGVEKALEKGLAVLSKKGSAIDACIEAVRYLENDPTFDAGTGAFLNDQGEVELDAIIMNGKDLSLGSVLAVKDVKNPVDLANLVRSETEHCVLASEGASQFAKKQGVNLVKPEELLTGRELERYNELLKNGHMSAKRFFDKPSKMGTVGAVAFDQDGNIACATSTGGTPNKMAGRVGDTPLVGSGAYANKYAGASTTGWGESIMKVLMAKTAVDGVEFGKSAKESTDKAIEKLQSEVNGLGGVILIDDKGEASVSFNTPFMARAAGNESGVLFVEV